MTNSITVTAQTGSLVDVLFEVTGTVSPGTDAVQLQLSNQNTTLPTGTWYPAQTVSGLFSGGLQAASAGTWYAWAYDPTTSLSAVSAAIDVTDIIAFLTNVAAIATYTGNSPSLRTAGYYAAGDGGGAFYTKTNTGTPAIVDGSGRSWHLQDVNGSEINILQFGADPTGTNDSTSAIQAAMDFAKGLTNGGVVTSGPGTFNISSVLTRDSNVSIAWDDATMIVATTTMASMITSSLTSLSTAQSISGGIWNCNFMANQGIENNYVQRLTLRDTIVYNSLTNAYKIGHSGASGSSFENYVSNIRTEWLNSSGQQPGASSVGLYLNNCTDSYFDCIVLVNHNQGVSVNNGGGNRFRGVHPWNHTSVNEMDTSFYVGASSYLNIFESCTSDQAKTYGWNINSNHTVLANCAVIKTRGTANNLVGVLDNTGGQMISDLSVFGSSSLLIAQDIQYGSGVAQNTTIVVGVNGQYVTTRNTANVLSSPWSSYEKELTTTSLTYIVSTGSISLGQNFSLNVFFRVVTATTSVEILVYYRDASGTSQTMTLLPTTSKAVGNYSVSGFVNSNAGSSVSVIAAAGTANQVFVSATIQTF